jgi:hypothetical protein
VKRAAMAPAGAELRADLGQGALRLRSEGMASEEGGE